MSFPNKEERQQCWDARDLFWKCLDEGADDFEKCKDQRQMFEKNCTKTWLKYFDRRRDYLKYKKKITEEGFEPVKDS